jgi:hypothetical protein
MNQFFVGADPATQHSMFNFFFILTFHPHLFNKVCESDTVLSSFFDINPVKGAALTQSDAGFLRISWSRFV